MNSKSFAKLALAHSRSGLSIRAFCRKAGIAPWSFYYWHRRARPHSLPAKEFVELHLDSNSPSAPASSFRLDFRGASLTLPNATLRQCLQILRDIEC